MSDNDDAYIWDSLVANEVVSEFEKNISYEWNCGDIRDVARFHNAYDCRASLGQYEAQVLNLFKSNDSSDGSNSNFIYTHNPSTANQCEKHVSNESHPDHISHVIVADVWCCHALYMSHRYSSECSNEWTDVTSMECILESGMFRIDNVHIVGKFKISHQVE